MLTSKSSREYPTAVELAPLPFSSEARALRQRGPRGLPYPHLL